MKHANMTRWIEAAESRRFCDAAMYDRTTPTPDRCRVRHGTTVAGIPSRILTILADGCRWWTSPR